MIPKTIHFCWFGRGEKSDLIKKCVESWREHLKDYEIIEWNEDNFDIHCNSYVEEAYQNRKFAFVADYARLKVMYEYGGIYLDSDVEVLKEFPEEMLQQKAFSGFESPINVPTGTMASEKGFPLFKEFLDYYEDKHFVNEDGTFNDITNVDIITNELVKRGLKRNNTYQVVDGFALYPKDYFCPLEDGTGKLEKTENTINIHWFAKSWWDQNTVKKYKRAKILFKILGKDTVIKLSEWKNKVFKKK